ncbi:NAD-dependent epimerase/dehydratase family protein [Amylibacter sp.]|nr:NAD-dependent epimerase/dehydratase family protein [Amylibacter sp.]
MDNIAIVAGGAGFIGANLLPEIILKYDQIIVIDNLSRGNAKYISTPILEKRVRLINHDLVNYLSDGLVDELTNCNVDVWHLAANSDIVSGVAEVGVDLNNTLKTTISLLDFSKKVGVKKFYFASSSAIYGDHGFERLSETSGPLLPISNYGAAKLASEHFLNAASEDFLEECIIFRFPNVVGIPATHGVIFDFIHKIMESRGNLKVLGDGSQQKSYLHVRDLVEAMVYLSNLKLNKFEVFNIGNDDDGVSVQFIAETVCSTFPEDIVIQYGSGRRGWVGDIPMFRYSTDKVQSTGWSPKLNSKEAIQRAVIEIGNQVQLECVSSND